MQRKLIDFASTVGLSLTPHQADTLLRYAQLVWQKKDQLNLTSSADLTEVLLRHICDGLQGAALVQQLAGTRAAFSVMDAGAGAGFIGITWAVALPQARVQLVESISKRCAFMNWAVLQLGLASVHVRNQRLGEKPLQADFITERAMGQLTDILPLCAHAVALGGAFIAYQGEQPQPVAQAARYGVSLEQDVCYRLPQDERIRHLLVFRKKA